ncbi:MAG: 23S rRNA (adenine(2503)-C(2))-methyltransferase RlmN [Candidatus Nealsonbacteria bacterium]|nr:23S rRNA (adenine(2503)-C(2))-methyltransferase RlmN [Candidatus Nealsonbacteria bacterium]
MNLMKIAKVLEKEPIFRLKQVKKAIFFDLIESWDKATTLPKNLRQKLSENCPLQELKAEKTLTSKDGETLKVLFKLKDGLKIESVLMKHEDGRRTVCVSSQVGCSIGCRFCATGQRGFKRNLSSSEIIDQVLFFARLLKKTKEKVTNVVFMGMGEPFLNYDNVLGAIKILNDKEGFNLGVRHISISTVGITEGVEKLAKEKLQVNLAISLHAPNNELRARLMPINKKYPIEKILAAVADYIKKTRRKVMFEYLMIDKANDSPEQAKELVKLLKKTLYFVNLISFNPIGHAEFKPSPGWKIKKFKEILEKAGPIVTQRYRFGREIKAACGQLAGENN